MQQIMTLAWPVLQWCVASPYNMFVTSRIISDLCSRYQRLSPEARAKVNQLVLQGGEMLAKYAVGEVIPVIRGRSQVLGLTHQAATVVEMGIHRAAVVGIEKAFEELRKY